MESTIETIIKHCHATLEAGNVNDVITSICTDSRKQIIPNCTLFVALVSPKNNGHKYIENLYNRGVRHFLVSENQPQLHTKATVIKVKDTMLALQQFASWHRAQHTLDVVAITGSNGKTIVKEWLAALLNDEIICKSPKSYNSQLGVPLSVLELAPYHSCALFEAGISTIHEMEKLKNIIQPNIGILTSIGTAHDSGFKNKIEKFNEKIKLFQECELVIAPYKAWINKHETPYELRLWSFDNTEKCYYQCKQINKNTVEIKYSKFTQTFELPHTDLIFIENCITAICAALSIIHHKYKEESLEFDTSINAINHALPSLRNLNYRMQLQEGKNNCTLINDTYSNDKVALQLALDLLKNQTQHALHSVIISEFEPELCDTEPKVASLKKLLDFTHLNQIHLIGQSFFKFESMFQPPIQCYKTTQDFIKQLPFLNFENEAILIKGARSFELEQVSMLMQKQSHGTFLEVNLDALIHNLNYYKKQMPRTVKWMVMVKAMSYGMGLHEIASVLQSQQIDYLAVAYVDEAVQLRAKRLTMPMLVMNVDEDHCQQVIDHQLEVEIYSPIQLKKIIKQCDYLGINYPIIHLKIETGMNRLGIDTEQLNEVLELVMKHNIKVNGAMSHLAASSDEEQIPFTNDQIKRFEVSCFEIENKLNYKVLKHILNTGGITYHSAASLDMVRLGIGIYGCDSNPIINEQLQVVATLKSYILQIKTLQTGETVGYNRIGKVSKPTKIATIALGYADGVPRSLSNGKGAMMCMGVKCPIIGNVCMDMTMIDVSEVANVAEGDEVEVFGNEIKIEQIAKEASTISYEILTGVSSRVKRLYIKET